MDHLPWQRADHLPWSVWMTPLWSAWMTPLEARGKTPLGVCGRPPSERVDGAHGSRISNYQSTKVPKITSLGSRGWSAWITTLGACGSPPSERVRPPSERVDRLPFSTWMDRVEDLPRSAWISSLGACGRPPSERVDELPWCVWMASLERMDGLP